MPESLDRYVIERQIGGGRLTAVFAARDPQGRPVALKRPANSDAAVAAGFRREVELLSRIKHPNVVAVLDASGGEQPYYAMPLLEGESLEARVRRKGALPPGEVVQIVGQVAAALDALHTEGIVHRDVTPANVMVLKDGRAVLIDFSVATVVGTRGQAGVGTPLYCAPEQWRGEVPAPSADVYGLGGVAYYALCGRAPYKELGTAEQTAAQHQSKAIRPPHEVNRGVSREVSAVVMRALARGSDRRWGTAGTFARRLEAAVAGRAERRASAPAVAGALLAGLALVIIALGAWIVLAAGEGGGGEPRLAGGLPPFTTATPQRTGLGGLSPRPAGKLEPRITVTLAPRRSEIVVLTAEATPKPTVTPIADMAQKPKEATQTAVPTQTPRAALNLELRGVSGQERWGMPTSPDGCSQFDDNQPVWRYKVSLTIRNTGSAPLTNWSVKLFNQGSPLNTCLLNGSYDPISPGQMRQIEVAAFLMSDPAVQARVTGDGRVWRLCFRGTTGVPC